MMKYFLYTIIIALFIACNESDNEFYPENADGLIKINVITPSVGTRSNISTMPENSTIRLYVYKYDTWNTTSPELVAEVTYRVNANGGTTLCNVDPTTGEPTGDITGTALHLPADTYNFYSVSPAIELQKSSSALPRMQISHGSKLSLRTSKSEGTKVEYFSAEVQGGRPGIFNLQLPAHTLLTSKLTFKLLKGNKIGKMEFVDTEVAIGETKRSSIVIDSLPPLNYGTYNFMLGNLRLKQMMAESGEGVLGILKEDIALKNVVPTGEHFYFETEVLPCRLLDKDGRPIEDKTEDDLDLITDSQLEKKVTEVRLHLNVAEIGDNAIMNYKVYTVKLPKEGFLRGKSYNYTLLVNLGGILVSSWDTSSNWETIIN